MAALFRSRRTFRWVLGGLALAFLLVLLLPEYLVELLWMQALGYAPVFWTILRTKLLLFALSFVLIGAFFAANVHYLVRQLPPLWASKWASEGEAPRFGNAPLTRARLRTMGYAVAGLLALAFAGGFAARWDAFLRFTSGQSYGTPDPVFGNDLAFYMLRLPFWEALQGTLVAAAFLMLLLLATTYILMGEVDAQDGRVRARPSVVRHLGLNLILLLLGWAWGSFLARYDLLLAPGGAGFGAGYTDLHVVLPALWVMVAAALGLAVLTVVVLLRYRFRWLAYGAALYALLFVLGRLALPALVQQVYVEPNELRLEKPYLEHNIALTREAFQLSGISRRSYPAQETLDTDELGDHEATIRNIRLWDPRLLRDTYRQIQEIRSYYQFYNVDIDRYEIDGAYRLAMLSGRELSQDVPGTSWVNRHLQYTHGYGSVLNLAAQQGAEGVPNLLLKDLPPVAADSNLSVDEPALYYAERVPTYRVVNTRAEEFDYPKGDDNVYTSYEGTGGVLLDGFWRQFLFAWQLSDYNILLSDYLQPGSRVQFWNSVQERVRRVAPFLTLDEDPYLVLSGQRQYWIQDAYTTAQGFPYGEPIRPTPENRSALALSRASYARNAVKVVVDAYDGSVDFYVADPDDPVLGVYREAFPGVFKPLSEMPADLQAHLRYPQGLFNVQIAKYNRYHMTVPRVFYNNEDPWERPDEQYGSEQVRMEPYYILTQLPDEEGLEFMLMTPLTPVNRDNMIAWVAARSDTPHYGELVVYELPKQSLIYGPNQIEATIDQQPEISEQLTLWDQAGSRVIRGNLIVVPIEDSFLYVEPVFLISEGAQIPQLERVIVAQGERVSMRRTLEAALRDVLDVPLASAEGGAGRVATPAPSEAASPEAAPSGAAPPPEMDAARQALDRAQRALRDGDLTAFGRAFEALEQALEETQRPDTASTSAPAGASVEMR